LAPSDPKRAALAVALFRYAVLSEVHLRVLQGELRVVAIREVAAHDHLGPDREPCAVSVRSIYRWLANWEDKQFEGLMPTTRARTSTSIVLEPALVTFLHDEKLQDLRASVPELIRRAVHVGLLKAAEDVDRTTVWRVLRRMDVPTRPGRAPPPDSRRFAKMNRLQLILCDGKHFRAGRHRAKRVAMFFIDDATRYALDVVVGTSETCMLFLRGLNRTLRRVGKADLIYFDHGSAFDAIDSHAVLSSLDIGFVHGTAGYPPGRGKVERFNRTAEEDILRDLEQDDVDPDCAALELRLSTWITEVYNRTPHTSLKKETPESRFLADDRPLSPYLNEQALRAHFFVPEERVVSNDHVISIDSVHYEVPRGLAGQKITVRRDVLDPTHLRLDLDGSSVRLCPVDLHANANARRVAGATPTTPPPTSCRTAATRTVERTLNPITDPEGGFAADPDEEPSWT
jgi:putative transposase